MIREPAVAGQFYPATTVLLKKTVEGLTRKDAKRVNAFGVVSPHAGFMYSGSVAGEVFSRVNLPDVYIIIGPNHTGNGRPFSIMADGSWRTPLGDVEIDKGLAKSLLKNSKFLQDDVRAHAFEHSIEAQLPFIQFFKKSFTFVPMILSHSDFGTYQDIAQAIVKAIKELNKSVLIVASSDMTHYEPQDVAKAKDKEAINAILELNPQKLLKKIDEIDITMCGYAPAAVMLLAAKAQGAKSAELVKYQTSGDVSGDYSSVVGYAGIIIV